MKKCYYVILILSNSIFWSEEVRPYQGQQLNYIHVLFEWKQEPYFTYYQIKITDNDNDSIKIIDDIGTTSFVEKEFISFNNSYSWEYRGLIDSTETGVWKGPFLFTTGSSKLNNILIENNIDSLIQPGLTLFGGPNPWRHSIIIDKNGKEIWNDSNLEFKINYIDDYGTLLGNSDFNYPNNKSCKINYDLDILWSSNQLTDNHDLKETSWGTFLLMRHVYSNGPIPSNNSFTQSFRNLGFVADDSTNEFSWYGQEIIEMDTNNQVLWNWNPFNYFSKSDFDNHGHTWGEAYQKFEYDWTHSNALYFDENESAIYLSSRHLSRITKIDYPSGDIIYNMSLPSEYISTGDSAIGNEMLFNFQHHIEKSGNQTFSLFDNGNISNLIFDHGQRISRALEFEVLSDTVTNILWEYSLPPNLFGHAGGSMKILNNNNRLIYTRGNGSNTLEPSIIEVNYDKEIVWKMKGPSNYAWYRAFRIPSLHPDRFSIIINNLKTDTNTNSELLNKPSLFFNIENRSFRFQIFNESDYSQNYIVKFSDDENWLESFNESINVNANSFITFSQNINVNLEDLSTNEDLNSLLYLTIFPEKHKYRKKTFKINLIYRNGSLSLKDPSLPFKFNLKQNYPNPFNPFTTLAYDLPENLYVSVTIYDMVGNVINNLVNKNQNSGSKSVQWDATNNQGELVSAGVYLYKIQAGEFSQTKKMILLK